MAKKVITFGEIMLRLAPEGYYRFVQADTFGATYGGGEANVAVSLANYGFDAKFVTKLPAHEIGQAAVNSLRKYGVDTSYITRGGDRVGIYFLEKGASQRPSKVIYDRAGSSIATATKEDFNWKEIFEGAEWFHFTGITPALNDNVAEICLEACKAAKEMNVKISCDLNYRNKLWSKAKAGEVMGELCKYVDVCIANEEDAADVFGIHAANTDVTAGEVNHEGYKDVAKQLADRFGFEKVAITLRESISANDNNWSAMLYDGTGTDRTILSGIHSFYEPEELVGKTLIAITNLPPRAMMGIDSCGMLLSAIHEEEGEEKLHLLMVDDHIPAGAKLY